MPNRKTAAFLSLHLLLAATASAGVVDLSKRAATVANMLDSPSQLQRNQPDEPMPEHDLSQIYRHLLVPRNIGRTNGQTNGQPDEPDREDNTEDAEERIQESVPRGPTPPLQPGSRGSAYPPTVPNAPGGFDFADGQYIPSDTMENEGEATKTIRLMEFDVAILYRDYVDRIAFSVYSPEENIFYRCTGGLFTGAPINPQPNYTPCMKEPSEGVGEEDLGSIAFAVRTVRVPGPLTKTYPIVLYIKYDNEADEDKSWTVPISIDDSHVDLVSRREEAEHYHYRLKKPTAFRALKLGFTAENN